MERKNKFLINCSFGHYPNGSLVSVKHFALILEESEIKDGNMFCAIHTKLVLLGFKLPEYEYMQPDDIHFTAQIFN